MPLPRLPRYEFGVSVDILDCAYCFDEFAASFLVVEGQGTAFVETNTAHAVPLLLRALAQRGFSPASVQYIVITHVHLDHAAGTAALARACPNARVLAHPRAARHLRDPAKLVAGATAVYGAARFAELYGAIEPVPADRIREMADGEAIDFGRRRWKFLHTRGHANHHLVLWDSELQATFTGDAFGVLYPTLQGRGLFIFPSTSPTDFDAEQAHLSIDRIASQPGDRAFLTHFGELRGLKKAAEQLHDWIHFSEELRQKAALLSPEAAGVLCQQAIDERFEKEMRDRKIWSDAHWKLTQIDRELNAAGLAHAAHKP